MFEEALKCAKAGDEATVHEVSPLENDDIENGNPIAEPLRRMERLRDTHTSEMIVKYQQALAENVYRPGMFLFDLADEYGRVFAEQLGCPDDQQSPVFIHAMPFDEAEKWVAEYIETAPGVESLEFWTAPPEQTEMRTVILTAGAPFTGSLFLRPTSPDEDGEDNQGEEWKDA